MLISILSRGIAKVFVVANKTRSTQREISKENKTDFQRSNSMGKKTSRKSISPNSSLCFSHPANLT